MYSKSINWTTGNGMAATVIVAVAPMLDGQGRERPGTAHIVLSASVGGEQQGCTMQAINHPAAVARIGRLGIPASVHAEILAAMDEAKNDAAMVEYANIVSMADKSRNEYERASAKINRAMME